MLLPVFPTFYVDSERGVMRSKVAQTGQELIEIVMGCNLILRSGRARDVDTLYPKFAFKSRPQLLARS